MDYIDIKNNGFFFNPLLTDYNRILSKFIETDHENSI